MIGWSRIRSPAGPSSRLRSRECVFVDLIRISIVAAAGLMLAASIWVLVDARLRRVPTRGNTYKADTGALAWFLGCLLLWPIVFPAYLHRRRMWGRPPEQAEAL